MIKGRIARSRGTISASNDPPLAIRKLRPYQHPAVQVRWVDQSTYSLCLVASANVPRSAVDQFDGELSSALPIGGQWIVVNIHRRGPVEIAVGADATIPLYVGLSDHEICLSWDLSDLLDPQFTSSIDAAHARRYIYGFESYTNKTMFEHISLVTERSTLRIDGTHVTHHFPDDSPRLKSRPTKAGANVVYAFDSVLGEALRPYASLPIGPVCEFSGGYDSSCVLKTVTSHFDDNLRSYGIIFRGRAGEMQSLRRSELLRLARCSDSPLPIDSVALFQHWKTRRPINTQEEPYAALVLRALGNGGTQARSGRPRVVFTGIGGDELFYSSGRSAVTPISAPAYLYTDFPKSVLPETALMAAICRAPVFLRKGVLPVNPYAQEEVVRFAERLPEEWKVGRQIQRESLVEWGLSAGLLHRPAPENFESILREQLGHALLIATSERPIWCCRLGVISQDEFEYITRIDPRLADLTALSAALRLAEVEIMLRNVYAPG